MTNEAKDYCLKDMANKIVASNLTLEEAARITASRPDLIICMTPTGLRKMLEKAGVTYLPEPTVKKTTPQTTEITSILDFRLTQLYDPAHKHLESYKRVPEHIRSKVNKLLMERNICPEARVYEIDNEIIRLLKPYVLSSNTSHSGNPRSEKDIIDSIRYYYDEARLAFGDGKIRLAQSYMDRAITLWNEALTKEEVSRHLAFDSMLRELNDKIYWALKTQRKTSEGGSHSGNPPERVEWFGSVWLFTVGFRELPSDLQADIMNVARKRISPKTDFLIFDPDPTAKEGFEDEGRSYRVVMPKLPKKVYVKLDDYGSAEALSEQMGSKVGTQYVSTFMLAEEY